MFEMVFLDFHYINEKFSILNIDFVNNKALLVIISNLSVILVIKNVLL